MALIIFPDPAADSFVTVAQADLYIQMLTMNSAQWMLVAPDDKERLLRIAYRDIIDHTDPKTYPNPLPVCVGESQALMAVHDTVNSLSTGVAKTTVSGALKQSKVGSISQSFYDTKTTGGSTTKVYRVPKSAWKCMQDLGYALSVTSDKFKQVLLGRS